MEALEHLADHAWKHPRDYGGFSPDGDYLILAQTRDSGTIDRSNYRSAFRALRAVAEHYPGPDDDTARNGWVYDFRAGHWACGWVEYLLVRADAPEPVLIEAAEILCALADYPVVSDDDLSELEFSEACACWQEMLVRDRAEFLRDHCRGVSIFSARRDELPDGAFDALREAIA